MNDMQKGRFIVKQQLRQHCPAYLHPIHPCFPGRVTIEKTTKSQIQQAVVSLYS